MPKVNPQILFWARETAGLSEGQAATKLKIRGVSGLTPVERLRAMESGERDPTRAMLVAMAKAYRRPLLCFYLDRVPAPGERGNDFRTLPEDHPAVNEALLDALIRNVQARQSLIRSAILDEDENYSLAFVGSAKRSDGLRRLLTSIQSAVDLPLDRFRDAHGADEAFQVLREHVEALGVFVLLLGNLGSHHTDIDLDTFRGFAIADDVAPFVVINDHDQEGAWSFTLLHELVHLWLGQTGVSGGFPEQGIEKFCNDIASEFLLPEAELSNLRTTASRSLQLVVAAINEFATERNISRSMVAYRLYRANAIDKTRWQKLHSVFRHRWYENRNEQRLKSKASTGGPNYYVVRRHRLGAALLGTTARFMAAGLLTTTKAGRILGVKAKNVEHLLTVT
jgi:Zn-dependent peptidase ImmA (M78 family)